MQQVIRRLPSKQQRIIERVYFGCMSQSHVAEYLGEPLVTGTTRTRLAMQEICVLPIDAGGSRANGGVFAVSCLCVHPG